MAGVTETQACREAELQRSRAHGGQPPEEPRAPVFIGRRNWSFLFFSSSSGLSGLEGIPLLIHLSEMDEERSCYLLRLETSPPRQPLRVFQISPLRLLYPGPHSSPVMEQSGLL